jgi:hypothetical protein
MGLVKQRGKIEKPDAPDRPGTKFSQQVQGFNEQNLAGIRAGLAPFVNIGEMLTTELQGADQVIMRMFLISDISAGAENAPLRGLIKLKETNPTADIRVVVDRAQATGQDYVNEALKLLQSKGITVEHEKGGKQNASGEDTIMHDKIVLAHYPENAETDRENAGSAERWTVMLGSSGLTKNVIRNWNYENLLCIDDKALFETLLLHHQATAANREAGVPEYKKPERRKAKKKKKETQVVPRGTAAPTVRYGPGGKRLY